MSSPHALGDTFEEDVTGELQATAPLCNSAVCLFLDTASHRNPGSPNVGQEHGACTDRRDFKGHSWLLDETHRSSGLPGVLCSRFVLKHRLHRCVPPTQASRGPGPAVGPQREGCRGSNNLKSLLFEVHEDATSTRITRHYLSI